MQRWLSCAIVGVLLLSTLIAPAMAAPASPIELIAFDYDSALAGAPDEIDAVLYPSGLCLPTKYCDLLDYIPYSGDVKDDDASAILNLMYPSAEGKFTYPEYMAARRFAFLLKAAYSEEDTNLYQEALVYNMSISDWSLLEDFTNVKLQDTERFCNALLIYKELLLEGLEGKSLSGHPFWSMLTQDMGEGFKLTAGSSTFYDYEPIGSEDVELSSGITILDYIGQMPMLWTYLNCTFIPTGLNAWFSDSNIVVGRNVIDSPFPEALTVEVEEGNNEEAVVIEGTIAADSNRKPEKPKHITPTDVTKDSYNVQVDLSQDGIMRPEKVYNFRDVVSAIALIFSVVASITLCVINAVRKHRDPLYKWMR